MSNHSIGRITLCYNREDEEFIDPTRSARCYSYIEEVGLGEMTNKN
jgi:hypothetical protein